MKHHSKESYKHRTAKHLLKKWLEPCYTVKTEEAFGYFQPDISIYSGTRLDAFYEITHTNPLNGKKLGLMQYWGYVNNIHIPVFEIEAEWILKQCEKPERFECDIFNI